MIEMKTNLGEPPYDGDPFGPQPAEPDVRSDPESESAGLEVAPVR